MVGCSASELADVDGYTVDILSITEDGERVAVIYHSGDRTLHPRTNEPLGHSIMRQRYLRNKGLLVLNLWDVSWLELEATTRASYLGAKLAEARRIAPMPAQKVAVKDIQCNEEANDAYARRV